ncbi:MAG: PTS sugar transporter subunit IIA [Deltaproteobacteria bacterium]|jgi:PTS system mannose-specific IIA component|nr:PTS sugar transporter subunit IIA [Deltaproteobacteria bacterium]
MSLPENRAKEPMVGVVVVSHEQVAFSLIEAARRVVGTIPNIAAACVSAGEDSASITHKVAQACGQVDDGAGVLLMVDVYGSTPFKVAMTMADGTHSAEVVSGVNLPMLLKLAMLDRCALTPGALAAEMQECGRKSIRLGSDRTGKYTIGGKV